MEAVQVIQIIDSLKLLYHVPEMQDKLNRWKSHAILMETTGIWEISRFTRELDIEAVLIRSIKSRIRKEQNENKQKKSDSL